MSTPSPAPKSPSGGAVGRLQLVRQAHIQELVIARAASKLGVATLSYGSMVHLAREGASEFEVVLAGASGYLAALIFGLQGGILADILPKRVAIAIGLGLQALLCFITPTLFGTDLLPLISLIFGMSLISQLTGPAMKSSVRIVTTITEVASVSALISLAGAVGSAVGSSLLAPLLVHNYDIRIMMYVAGVFFLLAGLKALSLPSEGSRDGKGNPHLRLRDGIVTPRGIAEWTMAHGEIASVLLVGAIVIALFESMNSLLPVYTRQVLNADPTLSVYIFAPASLAFFIGTIFSPILIKVLGERKLAVLSVAFIAIGAFLFGIIDFVAPALARISPLQLAGIVGIHLSDKILAAGMISILTNFGSTAAGAAIQSFVSRTVPVADQGRTFGIQEVIEQAITVIALLSLGGLGLLVGTRWVFLLAPIVIIGIGTLFVRYSYRTSGAAAPGRLDAARALLTGEGLTSLDELKEGDLQKPVIGLETPLR